jgi:hypothetical protein
MHFDYRISPHAMNDKFRSMNILVIALRLSANAFVMEEVCRGLILTGGLALGDKRQWYLMVVAM